VNVSLCIARLLSLTLLIIYLARLLRVFYCQMLSYGTCYGCSWPLSEVGTRNFFLSPQSQFRNLKETLPKSQFRNFLKKCCSSTATPQLQLRNSAIAIFSDVRNFKSTTWELHFRNFRHIFGHKIRPEFVKKKSEVKNLVQLSLSGKFFISRETDSSKNIFNWFLKPSWAEEKVPESCRIGRRLRIVAELRKSKFEGPQSQFRNFLVRNSAIDLVVRNIAELRRCGL
jgi:hypothetical protein